MELPFDAHFQRHYLNHMLRDSMFLKHVSDAVTPDVFSNEDDQRLARMVLRFFEENQAAPDTLIFHELDRLKEKNLLGESVHESISTHADGFFAHPLQNRDFLVREHDRFVRNQLFQRHVIPAAKLMQSGEYDAAEELLRECFAARERKDINLGREYTLEGLDERTHRRQDTEKQSFWHLIPTLDRRVDGLRRGELGIWQSQRSSAGKSAALVHDSRSFAIQGHNVAFVSAEMSVDRIEDRLDQCIVGIAKKQLPTARSKIFARLRSFFRSGGRIWPVWVPGGTTTITQVRDKIHEIANVHGFWPDVVILDYLQKFSPETPALRGDLFKSGAEIATTMRDWAEKDQLAMWTATQSNRAGIEATHADMEHMGMSLEIVNTADIIFSINRSPAEAEARQSRIFVVKAREDEARFSVIIPSTFETMQFYDHGRQLQSA